MSSRECWLLLLGFFLVVSLLRFTEAYDPIDPNGDITIKWDFQEIRDGGYTVLVNIHNNQLYRHIERPGWKFSWTWGGNEVIWDIRGAEATEQGDCSRFRGNIPHSCEKNPVIVDLLPGAPFKMQTQNCCRGGVLSSMTQDVTKYVSSFLMSVGTEMNVNDSTTAKPTNFSLGIPGYTCSNTTVLPPTKFSAPNTRHKTQALLTWQVTCSYSQFRASLKPTCCVSLSTFYNDTVVSCPHCSCGCQGPPPSSQCARDGNKLPDFLQLPHGDDNDPSHPVVMCTQHMCPIRVHWHLKTNYKQYWRVKITITNFNLVKNYSDWNLVIQHPNLESLTEVFSFRYKPLVQYGNINDTGMFWGIEYYNEILLEEGELGNVQSEMLLRKYPGIFTFQDGWAFPRRVLFDGHECVMPSPDAYPSLPKGSTAAPHYTLDRGLSLGLAPLLVFTVLLFL